MNRTEYNIFVVKSDTNNPTQSCQEKGSQRKEKKVVWIPCRSISLLLRFNSLLRIIGHPRGAILAVWHLLLVIMVNGP